MKAAPMKNQFIAAPPYRKKNGGAPMPPFFPCIPTVRQITPAHQWRTLRTNMKTAFFAGLLPRLKSYLSTAAMKGFI